MSTLLAVIAIASTIITILTLAINFLSAIFQSSPQFFAFRRKSTRTKQQKWRFYTILCLLVVISIVAGAAQYYTNVSSPANLTSLLPASKSTPTALPYAGQTPSVIPTPSPTPTPTPSLVPSPTPLSPKPGDILYQADWSQGMNGWAGGSDWAVVAGKLVNSGQQQLYHLSMSIAPYSPGDDHIENYAIEATIQLNRYVDGDDNQDVAYGRDMFGIIFQSPDGQTEGYLFAVCSSNTGAWNCDKGPHEILLAIRDLNGNGYKTIEEKPFSSPRYGASHTYRVEMKDNNITVLIDGVRVFEKVDYTYTSAGEVGVWSTRSQISVSSFKVMAM